MRETLAKLPGVTMSGKRKKLLVQCAIFAALFLVAEIILRISGMRAGTLIDDFEMEDRPVYLKRFESDEMGINHLYAKSEALMLGTVVNQQGFSGQFNYTAEAVDSVRKCSGQKVIMIIGDSFVEGCCADTITRSFPSLINAGPEYEVMNFGVAGTDPLQYELIARKYVKLLKPDLVVVAFYFGNDFLTYERQANPKAPLTFPFKKNKWIYATPNNYLSQKINHTFQSPEEAYEFYMWHYTLRGSNRNRFQKAISRSVIISKLYLLAEHYLKKHQWYKMGLEKSVDTEAITYKRVKGIADVCDSVSTPFILAGIPAPSEAEEGEGLEGKYKNYFRDIHCATPADLTLDDYDGPGPGNHFNSKGHHKYAAFLKRLIRQKLAARP